MNLVWHIAKKDIRRLAWPWALWLAFVAGSAAWFRLAAPPSVGDTPPAFVEWVAVMKVWTLLIGIGLCLVAGLLVGALGTEDPVSGSSGFWRTRPIGRLRLLAAKLLAGAILFLIAPTIAWAALWASWGFTIEELLASTRDTAVGWAAYALPAFTLAALSRTLVQFVYLSALAVAGLVAISFILAELFLGRSPGPLLPIQPDGLLWLYLAVCGAALVQHYLRPSWRTWLTMGLGLPLVLEFGYWREYEAGKRSAENSTPRAGVAVNVEELSLRVGEGQTEANPVTFSVAPSRDAAGRFYAPVRAGFDVSTNEGERVDRVWAEKRSDWGYGAALHVLKVDARPLEWTLQGRGGYRANARGGTVAGELEVWLAEATILGELGRERGSEIAHGASRTRVIGVDVQEGWERVLLIEERDSYLLNRRQSSEPELTLNSSQPRHDVFVLLNRAAGRAEVLPHIEHEAVAGFGQIVGFRRLHVPLAGEETWRRDAVIVKVRFERRDGFRTFFEEKEPTVRTRSP